MDTIDKRSYERYLKKLPELRAKLSERELKEIGKAHKMAISLELESFENELWIDFRDSNGLYSISSFSRIRRNGGSVESKDGNFRNYPAKIIKTNMQKGYYHTMISVNNVQRSFRVHREQAIHFVPNPLNLEQVNHITGIRHDNRLKNLEWNTHGQNQKHSFDHNGRISVKPLLGKIGKDCKNSKMLIQYDINLNKIKVWDSMADACRHFGLTYLAAFSFACKNGTISHGYRWSHFDVKTSK